MVRLIMCLRRISNLNREQFQHYWKTDHRSLVIERANILRIRKYYQLHTLDVPALAGLASAHGCPEEYDGIAEACFDSVDDLLAPQNDPDAARAADELAEDEKNFIDRSRSPLFLVRHDSVIDG
jgi:hypothetical protein